MENPRETILRCRKCRKGFIDSTCLYSIPATNDGSASQCSIWHVNIDNMPVWILTSVQQAQWTVGKLNCQNCGARLGSFNFLTHSRCLCGQDATVHLSKSRMDRDYKPSVPVVQPRSTRPGHGQTCLQRKQQRAELNRDPVFCPQLGCPVDSRINHDATRAVTSHAGTSHRLIDRDVTQSCHFKTRCCKPHRKLLEGSASTSSSAISPSSLLSKAQVEVMTGTEQSSQSLRPCQPAQLFNNATDPLMHTTACHSAVYSGRRSLLEQEGLVPSGSVTSPMAEVSVSATFCRGRTTSDSIGEQQEDQRLQALASAEQNRLTKRERNRLKSLRRKQRKRERWMLNQKKQSSDCILTDGEEEDGEGYICAVCLDVYYNPYSCQPCGHVFCEPCLRTLAKSRASNTPCPLCRTSITHTLCEKELNQTIKTFFPKVYHTRKENFQKTTCAKWPLPSSRRQRNPVPGGRWHYIAAGFTLDPLDIMFLATIFVTYFFFS